MQQKPKLVKSHDLNEYLLRLRMGKKSLTRWMKVRRFLAKRLKIFYTTPLKRMKDKFRSANYIQSNYMKSAKKSWFYIDRFLIWYKMQYY